MARAACRLVGLLLLISATTALKCPARGSTPGREIVCYTSRSDPELLENAICRCTTLVHQGHDLQHLDASEVKSLRDSAKEANPEIRVLLSISDKHELLKNSATTRKEAAGYLTDILKEVDGVELNVTAGSKERLVSFVKGLKDEMLNKSLEKMILLALPTKPEDLAKQFELKELSKYVDLFTVATHYLRDSDEAYRAFHPSRLMGLFDMLNTDSLVDLISGMGAPKQKILISAPSSAYRFTLTKAQDNTPRSPTVDEQPAVYDRKKLCDAMNDGEWTVERDEDLTAPYAFKNTTWIAFEDETSLKIKGKYVILRELAGMGLRDVENDSKNDCGMSVAQAVYRAFTEMKRKTREVVLSSLEKDLKGTEIAYPRHVRSSDFRIVRVVDTAGKIRAVRENTQTAFTCSHQGYFVHPKSCNRFYRCVKFNQEVDDYSVFEFDCPAGLAFDEGTEVCVWPGSISKGSACRGSSEIEPVPRGRFRCPSRAGYYADPNNCRWFFACYDLGGPEMVPYEFRCPFGLVFDEQRLVCEWPWKVPNCDGPGHGDGHSVYNYGGAYGGQEGYVPQGGIIGQGGFVGQGGFAGQGFVDAGVYSNQGGQGTAYNGGAYDGQTYNAAGTFGAGTGVGYDSQTYNAAEAGAGAGAGYDGQTYNAAGAGVGAGYDGQTYNAAGAGAGAGYDGQTYNAAGAGASAGRDGQNYNAAGTGAGAGNDGQTYNSAGAGVGAVYEGQTYNAAGAGAGSDGQNFNAAGAEAGYDGASYNAAGANAGAAGAGVGYSGQNYNTGGAAGVGYGDQTNNAGGAAGSGAGYEGHTYNAGAAGAGVGAGFGGQTYNAGEPVEAEYDGQTYNEGGAAGAGAGAGYDGQTYNEGGSAKAGAGYNGQNFNADGGAGTGAGYDGQKYNTAGTAGTGYTTQTYNAGGASGAGAGYTGQTYNTGGAAGAGAGHAGQTYNAGEAAGAAVGNAGKTYNAGGAAGQTYNAGEATGQTYNAGGATGQTYNAGGTTGADYDGQTYNAGGAAGQTYNAGGVAGQTYNAGGDAGAGAGADYDGQTYNAGETSGTGAGAGYEGQTYNAAGGNGAEAGRGPAFGPNVYNGPNLNGAGNAGHGADCDQQNYNGAGAAAAGIDYDGQHFNGAGAPGPEYDDQGFNRPEYADANGGDYNGQNFNGNGAAAGVDTEKGVVTASADYDDIGGQGNIYANGGVKTTTGINNFAGNTREPTGITAGAANFAGGATDSATGYSAGATNGYTAGVTTGYTAGSNTGINNFAGVTDSTRGVTSQDGLAIGGRLNTNFAQGQNTNFNTFGSTAQTGLFAGAGSTVGIDQNRANGRTPNPGFSTISYGNTAGSTGLFGAGNTQYTGGAGPIVYNASYSAGSGYPTSTILPYVPRENAFNPDDSPRIKPVNSMGLTSTENFGTQYTNQAEKSFATQGRTPTGFAFNGRTQNTQNFNTATNVYDNSKVNLAGVTPSITLIRDGTYNSGNTIGNSRTTAGLTNFGSSTIAPGNFNTGARETDAYDNSQLIGSNIASENNDITRFRESTGTTDNFRFNGNTAANTGFRTDGSSATFFNQGTIANQNPYIAAGFTRAPQNAVTPATIAQNFNNKDAAIPGVVPLNNARPAVELDNTGIFGTNFAGPSSTLAPGARTTNIPSTTPQSTGYRTNEYYDNGGRGTIRYNNGLVANKVTETDIQDYRTSPYTRIPNSFIINAGNGENAQSTIQKSDGSETQQFTDGTFTRGGFTKTGPTKTGITTAQVGGSGSYVLGTGSPRARPDPQFIGEQAFAGSFGTTGSATNFGAAGTTATNFGTAGSSTNFKTAGTAINFGRTEGAANAGARGNAANFGTTPGASNFAAAGTATNFGTTAGANNFGAPGTATNFRAPGTATNFGAPSTVTNFGAPGTVTNFVAPGTATNFGTTAGAANFAAAGTATNFGARGVATNFDVTGSTPNFGTSQLSNGFTANDFSKSNTAFGTTSETAGYSYPRPLVQLELKGASTTPGIPQTSYYDSTTPSSISNAQSFNNQNSVIIESAQNNRGFSTTVAPVGFTTGQLENFRTTVYQAAKVPQRITTVQPVIDTGSRTVISSTPIPAVISTQRPTYQPDDLSTRPKTYLDVGVSFDQGYDYVSTGNIDYSDITSNFDQGNFGQKVTGQTRFTNINYQQPTTNARGVSENSPLITSTQDYNSYTETGIEATAQTGSLRTNQPNELRSTVTIPNQVYLPSSTLAPAVGVTFRRPIVAAEFSQGQFDQSSTAAISQKANAAEFASRGTANRVLSNQAPANFVPQRSPNGVLINQASADFATRGSSNGILNNQASAGFASQGTAAEFSSNQASANFGSRGSTNGFFGNQGSANFGSQGSSSGVFGNQGSANFGPQGPANGIFGNQGSSDFASRGSANGVFGSQGSANFGFRGSSSGVFGSQGSANFGSQGSANGVFGSQGSADFASRGLANGISSNQATSYANQNQGFSGQTRTLAGSNVVTSIGGADLASDLVRQNVGNQQNVQIISEFNRAEDANFRKIQQSTTIAPEVTTYTGDFSRTRGRIETNSQFNAQNQNRKVIVKLSDLHPLILGKLGAECTCRADPFAVFRGPNRQTLPINSRNRGPVDLANYDESDIYVDVDSDKENDREIDFVRNIPSSRLIKTSNGRFNAGDDDTSIVVSSRGEPASSTYLPPTTARTSSTYLPPSTAKTLSTYLPPSRPSNEYLPSSTETPFAPVLRENQASLSARAQNRQPLLIRVEDDKLAAPQQFARDRAGKALFDGPVGSPNGLRDQGASFDRYGPGGLRSNDEKLQGGLDCARSGLFRHPKFCNKFYACHWDEWKKRYTLHVFNCPVHLAFDSSVGACNYPTKGPACQDNKLLI